MRSLFKSALAALPALVLCGGAWRDVVSGLSRLPAQARAPVIAQLAELTASDGQSGDLFGYSVAINGDTIAVGAWQADNNEGAVYVFVKPAGGWTSMTETAKLTPSAGLGGYFGQGVCSAGKTIVAVAPGAMFVYVEPNGGWTDMTQTAELTSTENMGFVACSISADGNTIVGGSPSVHGGGIGKAYIFERPTGGWVNMTQTAELQSTDGKDTGFGTSCGMSGNTIVVGAPYIQAGYIFVEPAGGWKNMTQTARLTANGIGTADDLFGSSVAISGNEVAIGAPFLGQLSTGGVYEFTKPAGGWMNMTQTAELLASNPFTSQALGNSVFVAGRSLAAGAPSLGHTLPGAVYGFVEPGGGWKNETQKIELMSLDDAGNADFGWSLAASEKVLAIGAYNADGPQVASGAAYVFGKQP